MVQEVSLTFEQSNMNSFLTQGQVFSQPEIFLRELIKNSYDACRMRVELEQSWGHTFLELNHELLEAYSEADTSAEVVRVQNEFLENK